MMNRLLLFLALTIFGCSKAKNTANNSASNTNSITLIENGITRKMSGTYAGVNSQNMIAVHLQKGSTSWFSITTKSRPGTDFDITIKGDNGPANGIGTYKITQCIYTQTFSGGLRYTTDTGIANVTTASNAGLAGTFTVFFDSGKVITGDFDTKEILVY